jgi:flagellar biosynthesis chaperone FliJ
VTIPKAPRPQRILLLFDSVINGLNTNINDIKTKVYDLTSAVTNGYNAMAKQLLQYESFLRHLEQRIDTLIKLQANYKINLKIKDGIQSMYDAYKKSPGNQQKNLINIKNGWKECIQILCAIEAQTEALLGTFEFKIEKLIGFARLCPGDIYELQIKYGSGGKFRTRTKIAKNNSQHWARHQFKFKITVQDLLTIRINEIKFLGKNLLIGEKICDSIDLFSTTQTQRLTFNANTSGSLKLSMLITWLPFENCEESFVYYNPTQYLTLSSKEKRLSSFTMSKLSKSSQASSLDSPTSSSFSVYSNTKNVYSTQVTTIINYNKHDEQLHCQSTLQSCTTSSSSSSSSSSSASNIDNEKRQSLTSKLYDDIDNVLPSSSSSSTSSSSSSSSSSQRKTDEIIETSSAAAISPNHHSGSLYSYDSLESSNKSNSVQDDLNKNIRFCEMKNRIEIRNLLITMLNEMGHTETNITSPSPEINKKTLKNNNTKVYLLSLFEQVENCVNSLSSNYIELNDLNEITQKYRQLFTSLSCLKNDKTSGDLLKSITTPIDDSHQTNVDEIDDILQCFDFLDKENDENAYSDCYYNDNIPDVINSTNNNTNNNKTTYDYVIDETSSLNLISLDFDYLLIGLFQTCLKCLNVSF